MPIIGPSISVSEATTDWREQIQHLLDSLDGAREVPVHEARRDARRAYRTLNVAIKVLNARGEVTCELCVPTRNISARGLAFLHKQMLAVGSQLRIDIPLIDETHVSLLSRVTRCRHIKGMMHEIGVEFVQEEPDTAMH